MLSTRYLTTKLVQHILKTSYIYKHGSTVEPIPFILVNAFFEPSTRTSLSFESAAYRLGGNVISFQKDMSSMKKGERFEDTVSTLSSYGDVMVMRHPEKGAVGKAAEVSHIPVINGGDGDGEHPTQALLDLFTIYDHFRETFRHHPLAYLDAKPKVFDYEPYNVLLVGDLLHSRTIHSLLHLLYRFTPINVHVLPYKGCEPVYGLHTMMHNKNMQNNRVLYNKETVNWSLYDVVYVTRMQKERSDEQREVDVIIDKSICEKMKDDAIIMHPLPRNEEIHTNVDKNKRCRYFEQMDNGVYVRMAILELILAKHSEN
jgi:aspartate carbamoyltransferase